VISLDTKNRELIGRFFQDGLSWGHDSVEVFDHVFPPWQKESASLTASTTRCATRVLSLSASARTLRNSPWTTSAHGGPAYPKADEILLLADCGGSNGYEN